MIEKFTVEIAVGDRVEVGRMHLANQTIKAIEIDKWGHPVIVLESGRKRGLLNCRLKKLIPDDVERVQEPAEVMMTKEQWAEAQAKIDQIKKHQEKSLPCIFVTVFSESKSSIGRESIFAINVNTVQLYL